MTNKSRSSLLKTPKSKKQTRNLFLEQLENRDLMAITPIASTNFLSPYPTLPGVDIPVGQMPIFSSNPNSPFKLYLDFDGVTTATWRTLRDPANPQNGFKWDPIVSKAFDVDDDPTTYNAVEQKAIFDTWRYVAEDYSNFNVDVRVQSALESAAETRAPGTTIASDVNATVAGTAAIMTTGTSRVAIGGFDDDWFKGGAAGVAFLGVFSGRATGWAWQGGDATDPDSWWVSNSITANNGAALARIVSHEAGHMMGLNHQSKWLGSTMLEEYSSGRNGWAPIMGAGGGYDTWWIGPTPPRQPIPDPPPIPLTPANPAQDDMRIIANNFIGSTGAGLPVSTDGYRIDAINGITTGNSVANAFDVDRDGGSLVWGNSQQRNFRASSVIGQNTDVDYFKFSTRTGYVDLTLRLNQFAADTNTDTYAPNLSAVVDIFDSKLQKVATFSIDPQTLNSNYEFRLQQGLGAGGVYYIAVHGVGVTLGSKPLPGQPDLPIFPVQNYTPEQIPVEFDQSKYGRVGSYTIDLTYIPSPSVTLTRDNTASPTPGLFTMAGTDVGVKTGVGSGAWKYVRNVTGAQDSDVSVVARRGTAATAPTSTATFTFSGLQPGVYRVFASWTASNAQGVIVTPTTASTFNTKTPLGANSRTVQYQVLDGSRNRTTLLQNRGNGAGVVDQRTASGGSTQVGFTELTNVSGVQVLGNTVFVRVSNSLSRDGNVIADSVRLVRIGDLPPGVNPVSAPIASAPVSSGSGGSSASLTNLAMAAIYAESQTPRRR